MDYLYSQLSRTTIITRSSLESVIHKFGTLALIGEGEIIIRSSHEIAGQVIIYLNVELELALTATQKFLNSLTTYV